MKNESLELWKPITGFDKYLVSNKGRIKSLWFGKEIIMKQGIGHLGYANISLRGEKGKKHLSIHRLVAKSFIPQVLNKVEVNHKDGNKLNNCVENLEWSTRTENLKHAYSMGLRNHQGENHPTTKLKNADVLFIRSVRGIIQNKDLAKIYNLRPGTITEIMTRRRWKHI